MTDAPASNAHEYTVSELSGALKKTVEDTYGHVRVRGELGRVTVARSGHVYLDMKDERAVIDAVMWKGLASSLNFRPEEGLEVVAEGRLSTFPGRSKYQLIIERLEPAGEGALMALLEARKKALAAEGLFAPERKRDIPFLPRVIGVVTSPTGAVIRDILHRLSERFPVHVLLWPVRVQGEGAAAEIAAGIEGLNALPEGGGIPQPDLIIVARGGGSIEDLWAFNEEIVVRAAAASRIPLISAVGHETDTTLIDYASDLRAPTPTGAAERAVPVRRDLAERIAKDALRLSGALQRSLDRKASELKSAGRALGRPDALLQGASQRLDYAADRLERARTAGIDRARVRLDQAAAGLRPAALKRDIAERGRRLAAPAGRLGPAFQRSLADRDKSLASLGARLNSVSHERVLARGFALVTDAEGRLVRSATALEDGQAVSLRFADGERAARIGEGGEAVLPDPPKPDKKTPARSSKPRRRTPPEQGSLF
ncbi:MAG: exodeoxyribonuclease VII large subunit [Alphaproteobacteria bacterium]|nr:exodeoxyribonuclease VII large subunit [Alphaproteobacteria bacterium]